MTGVTYKLACQRGLGGTVTYGIAVCEAGEVEILSDLSCDREAVASLVETCNRLELSRLHVREVAEDFVNR